MKPVSIARSLRVAHDRVADGAIAPGPSIALANLVIEYFTDVEAWDRAIETDEELARAGDPHGAIQAGAARGGRAADRQRTGQRERHRSQLRPSRSGANMAEPRPGHERAVREMVATRRPALAPLMEGPDPGITPSCWSSLASTREARR